MKHVLLLVILSCAVSAHAEVFKCKAANGSTTFSSAPCAPDARPIQVSPASGRAPAPAPYLARHASDLSIGSAPEDAVKAWGKPSHVNRTTDASGGYEQWVYRDGHVTKYLYFHAGRLRSIQD